jgi:hypothetical protein
VVKFDGFRRQGETLSLSLWNLLIVLSSASFMGGALAAARIVNGGVGSYVLAGISGLLMAMGNWWMCSKISDAVDHYLKPLSELQQERCPPRVYLIAAIWVPCSGVLGVPITLAILRLVA